MIWKHGKICKQQTETWPSSIESIEKLNNREHGDALKKGCKAPCTTDLSDLMVLDGRFEHNHSEPDERSIQRHKVCQECKHKASDEPGERPNKVIDRNCKPGHNRSFARQY